MILFEAFPLQRHIVHPIVLPFFPIPLRQSVIFFSSRYAADDRFSSDISSSCNRRDYWVFQRRTCRVVAFVMCREQCLSHSNISDLNLAQSAWIFSFSSRSERSRHPRSFRSYAGKAWTLFMNFLDFSRYRGRLHRPWPGFSSGLRVIWVMTNLWSLFTAQCLISHLYIVWILGWLHKFGQVGRYVFDLSVYRSGFGSRYILVSLGI